MKVNLKSNVFIKNVTILVSGTAMGQIISFLLMPVITRVYGPESYGIMGTFTSIVSIFTPIVALTYPIAIVLPKKAQDAMKIVKLCIMITLFVTIISLGIILLFGNSIVKIFQIEVLAPYLYLIPITLLFAGFLQITEQWLIRENKFYVSARANILQTLLLQSLKAGIGFIYPSTAILIFLTSLTHGVKALIMTLLGKLSYKNILRDLHKDKNQVKILAKQYKDFPFFRAPQTMIDAITVSIPVLFLSSLFSQVVAGYYTLAKTTLNVPVDLISKAVGDVFYPRISTAANSSESLSKLIMKTTATLFIVGIIPFGLIIVIGPQIFTLIFGSEWTTAGLYSSWLAVWSFSTFILQPSLRSLPVLNAQKFHLIFTVVSLTIRLVLIVLGNLIFSSDVIAVALFAGSSAFFNIVLILYTVYKSAKYDYIKSA